ncbi:SPOR domain-containing protein [Hydrogenophaga sp. PBL-H3]|uniref:SPOR domain-containing protein n=1 Tax=Hydrogenophaga sp. PBL-H3 TaxID=434010 RepID=UPI00131F6B33|nr:SPOR domain-containing protein [Hydrogenophaga sp. PBL-H3]QHE74942.1 sporulation protein [Hydrogenophaga sp. PBL-H3]QHE79369.1 sporulation protein [Hydrogenophaga sp. PBL-H3]
MKKKPVQSRSSLGGTLIGLVVGLLVGLGIALAVAVYVTRVPIPFVDRNVSRNAGQDALEAERNKGWNPNKVLNGDAATAPTPAPAAPPAAAVAPGAAGAIVVPPADGKGLPPVPAAGSKPATDPLGELVQSKLGTPPAAAPATAAAAPAPGADPFTYFVQAGAFRSPEDAEAQRAKLAMLGINADVTEREQSGRTVYRVRVGPFNQKAMADLTQEQLQANGVEAALVRVQR